MSHRSFLNNRKAVGVLLPVLVQIIIVAVMIVTFGFIFENLFSALFQSSPEDQSTLDSFNALALEIEEILAEESPYVYRDAVIINIAPPFMIVGFGKDETSLKSGFYTGTYVSEPYHPNSFYGGIKKYYSPSLLQKPETCSGSSCLCLFKVNGEETEQITTSYSVSSCKNYEADIDFISLNDYFFMRSELHSYFDVPKETDSYVKKYYNDHKLPAIDEGLNLFTLTYGVPQDIQDLTTLPFDFFFPCNKVSYSKDYFFCNKLYNKSASPAGRTWPKYDIEAFSSFVLSGTLPHAEDDSPVSIDPTIFRTRTFSLQKISPPSTKKAFLLFQPEEYNFAFTSEDMGWSAQKYSELDKNKQNTLISYQKQKLSQFFLETPDDFSSKITSSGSTTEALYYFFQYYELLLNPLYEKPASTLESSLHALGFDALERVYKDLYYWQLSCEGEKCSQLLANERGCNALPDEAFCVSRLVETKEVTKNLPLYFGSIDATSYSPQTILSLIGGIITKHYPDQSEEVLYFEFVLRDQEEEFFEALDMISTEIEKNHEDEYSIFLEKTSSFSYLDHSLFLRSQEEPELRYISSENLGPLFVLKYTLEKEPFPYLLLFAPQFDSITLIDFNTVNSDPEQYNDIPYLVADTSSTETGRKLFVDIDSALLSSFSVEEFSADFPSQYYSIFYDYGRAVNSYSNEKRQRERYLGITLLSFLDQKGCITLQDRETVLNKKEFKDREVVYFLERVSPTLKECKLESVSLS